jgi:nucleoside-diphosphate-sugar epimerase
MNVLVFGGTRFIGPSIVNELDREGHDVTIFHRGQNEVEFGENISHVQGERGSLHEKVEEFKKTSPDVVVDTYLLNEVQAKDVTDAFAGIAQQIVVLSSIDDAVAGKTYNVTGDFPPGTLDWGKSIADAICWYGNFITIPDENMAKDRGGTGQGLVVDTTKIRSEPGYKEIVSFKEGLNKTIEWELANIPKDLNPYQSMDSDAQDTTLAEINSRRG